MKNRPFKKLPIELLESMYQFGKEDITLLTLLKDELNLREDIESARLFGRISLTIELNTPNEKVNQNFMEMDTSDNEKIVIEAESAKQTWDSNDLEAEEEYFACPACGNIPEYSTSDTSNRYENCQNPECNRVFYVDYEHDNCPTVYSANKELSAGIICIDFGTSSIRAALANSLGEEIKILDLGEFLGLSGEDFSIPTNIYVSKDVKRVYFGDSAYTMSKRHPFDALVIEPSPKKWITLQDSSNLFNKITLNSPLNWWHLLIGLLAQSIHSIKVGLTIGNDELKEYEIRISHPVWASDWKIKKVTLEQILVYATEISDEISMEMDTIELIKLISSADIPPEYIPQSDVDIIEPVAAVVELFHEENNSRQVCAVIDIGAGTTDIGLFLSLTPDAKLDLDINPYRRKFKPLANPISLNFAGDYIDKAIIEIYIVKSKLLPNDEKIKQFEIEIRERKLEIFSNLGKTNFMGIDITYEELADSKNMAIASYEISNGLTNMILSADETLSKLYELRNHYIREINLIFAGGGQGINFIRDAIPKYITLSSNAKLPIKILNARDGSNGSRLAIDAARLAVCRGGTTCSDEWPNTNPDASVIGPNDSGPWL